MSCKEVLSSYKRDNDVKVKRKVSDYESSEEEDFKSPKNTVKGMRIYKKTSEIETTNQFESLMEEDIDEDLHEDNHPKEEDDKDNEGNRKTKKTTKSPG
ncbi:hypothetical protein HHI36_017705 [Cryptolaemus montrouzieri]|uniref:Uncharacterized protein n=1 Tax=Cryptolaemus montrouzieri TaxID=559131 RepID=A0ABD2NPV1_9CUCU